MLYCKKGLTEAIYESKRSDKRGILAAFKTLSRKGQDIFLTEILKDKRLCEDPIDIAIAESMAKDKGRPFRDFLKEHNNLNG